METPHEPQFLDRQGAGFVFDVNHNRPMKGTDEALLQSRALGHSHSGTDYFYGLLSGASPLCHNFYTEDSTVTDGRNTSAREWLSISGSTFNGLRRRVGRCMASGFDLDAPRDTVVTRPPYKNREE